MTDVGKFHNPGEDVQRESHEFGNEEIGLNHPNVASFIRLRDDGVIEINADDGVSIQLDPQSRSISFIADRVKFFTREEGGIRWNEHELNNRATRFDEPALVEADDQGGIVDLYKNSLEFLADEDEVESETPQERIVRARQRLRDLIDEG